MFTVNKGRWAFTFVNVGPESYHEVRMAALDLCNLGLEAKLVAFSQLNRTQSVYLNIV